MFLIYTQRNLHHYAVLEYKIVLIPIKYRQSFKDTIKKEGNATTVTKSTILPLNKSQSVPSKNMKDNLTYNIISQHPLTAREPTISQQGSPKQIIPQLSSKNRSTLATVYMLSFQYPS